MQQKIQQALADSPLSNAILSALEVFYQLKKCGQLVMNLSLRLFN